MPTAVPRGKFNKAKKDSIRTRILPQPWYFKSLDGRFDMVLEPFFDQSSNINLIIYSTDTIKVHGNVSGHVVLDDGTVVEIHNFLGFAEHAFQKW